VRSILKFVFVVVPTAVLATAVAVGVSRNGQGAAATVDGDLQRDLKLASTTTLELAPVGQPLATVSSIEAPPAATPERTVRPRRSSGGSRAIRSRARTVRAAPEPEVAESTEESETTEVEELAGAATEATVDAPADGGVALPRPTAIPVSFPTDGGDAGTYDPGPGTVIRGGGGVYGDPCRVHGGGIYGRPVYRQPRGRGITLADRIRGVQRGGERPASLGDRIRASQAGGSRGGFSIGDRVRSAQGRTGTQGSSRGSLAGRIRTRAR
jgi:hypothetical protein